MSFSLRHPIIWFSVATLAVLACSLYITSLPVFFQDPYLSLGVTLDLSLGIPLLFYLLMVRRYQLSPVLIVPVFVLSVLLAGLVLPGTHQFYLGFLRQGLILAEGIALLAGTYKLRALIISYRRISLAVPDFPERLTQTFTQVFGNSRFHAIFVSEIAVLYYALAGWRIRKEARPAQLQWTYHTRSGYVLIWTTLIFVLFLETILLHLLLMQWSETAAWIITAGSAYGFLFLVADLFAILKRPIISDSTHLYIRIGLRWRVTIPRSVIEQIQPVKELDAPDKQTLAAVLLLGQPDVLIHLKSPVEVTGMYGIRKRVSRIALPVDQPEAFRTKLGQAADEL
jgi:ABC-type multidrug transport system fused ATPase/permease subunit